MNDDLLNPKPAKPIPAPSCDMYEVDNITATLRISRQELEQHMRKLYQLTNADNFISAMQLGWYKFDANRDIAARDMMSLLVTLHRCELDSAIRPPVSLSDFYRDVNNLDNLQSSQQPR